MKAIILGNCANQTDTNEAVSIIVEGQTKLLIDAGPGVVRQILKSGRKCSEFEHIFITHSHGDHTAGFPYLIWNFFFEFLGGVKVASKINIYTTEGLADGLLTMLKVCYVIDNFPFTLNFNIVSDTTISEFNIGEMIVRTVPVIHTTKTFGLRIDEDGKSISYSADTLYSEEFTNLASNSDLLIHEGFATEELLQLSKSVKHGLGSDAGLCAFNSKSKKLIMVHFFPPFKNRLNEIVNEAMRNFDGDTSYAEELKEYDV